MAKDSETYQNKASRASDITARSLKNPLWSENISNHIFTLPNIISFARLCLIPLFFFFLIKENNAIAFILFVVAASTDWVDGFLARHTHSVSKLGTILDPAVDRLLMIFAVIGTASLERLPIWIMILVFLRDVIMFFGYYIMYKRYKVRIDVILAGKVATTLLYIGLAGLILYRTLLPGLGLLDYSWLPGFNAASYSWGMWFIYAGVLLGIFTTAYYACIGILACQENSTEPKG